jgi:MarR family transcriptional regulator, transcriptional regulator for hemolysin
VVNDGSEGRGPREPLGRTLVFTAREMRRAFEQALTAAGGSLGTWVVLSALSVEGVVSQAALASHVHLEGATITHHVDRLEALGLVTRVADPDDRRVRRVTITPEGERLHARLLAAVIELEAVAWAGVSDRDRTALGRSLARIRSNLDARER